MQDELLVLERVDGPVVQAADIGAIDQAIRGTVFEVVELKGRMYASPTGGMN